MREVLLVTDNNSIQIGEETEVSIFLEDATTAAFDAYVTFDANKLECTSQADNISVSDGKVIILWYDKQGGENAKSGQIAKIKFKAKKEGTVNLQIAGKFYDENAQELNVKFTGMKININTSNASELSNVTENASAGNIATEQNAESTDGAADNANGRATLNNNTQTAGEPKIDNSSNLEVLAIENVLLYPPFDENITEYEAEVSNTTESVNIFVAPVHEAATTKITGEDNLKEGDNNITIMVTSENGTSTKQYNIKLHKRNQAEEEAYRKEQSENKEKLEQAYNIEKLTTASQSAENQESTEAGTIAIDSDWAVALIVCSIVIITVMIVLLSKMIKKRK